MNGTPAPTVQLLSLSEDVLVETSEQNGSLVVVSRWSEIAVVDPDETIRELLRRMALGPVTIDNVLPGKGPGTRPDSDQLDDLLARLSGAVVWSLGLPDGQTPVLSAVPTAAAPRFELAEVARELPLRLSRFASLRACNGELAVESPVAGYRVCLHRSMAAGLATALAEPRTLVELAALTGVELPVAHDVVAHLTAAGVVVAADEEGDFAEDTDPAWLSWTVDDLRFHCKSRSWQGVCAGDLPANAPASAPPALKPVPSGPRFALPVPAEDDAAQDVPLRALLETDRTCPDFSGRDLALADLGQLLHRSARVRGVGLPHLPRGMSHEATQRPYLSIACLYELEVYLSVGQCRELPRGIYYYDPAGHELTLVNADETDTSELLDMAKLAAGCVRGPAALLSLTARMDRMTVLGGAAYRTTLQHAGALQQTIALVAATLGLAAHPVAVDAHDSVDRALSLTWRGEVCVAECVLDQPA